MYVFCNFIFVRAPLKPGCPELTLIHHHHHHSFFLTFSLLTFKRLLMMLLVVLLRNFHLKGHESKKTLAFSRRHVASKCHLGKFWGHESYEVTLVYS